MTIHICLNHCSAIGFGFAGVFIGVSCYCGNVQPPLSKFVPYEQCNFPCTGDESEMCGGMYKTNIYSTSIYSNIKSPF